MLAAGNAGFSHARQWCSLSCSVGYLKEIHSKMWCPWKQGPDNTASKQHSGERYIRVLHTAPPSYSNSFPWASSASTAQSCPPTTSAFPILLPTSALSDVPPPRPTPLASILILSCTCAAPASPSLSAISPAVPPCPPHSSSANAPVASPPAIPSPGFLLNRDPQLCWMQTRGSALCVLVQINSLQEVGWEHKIHSTCDTKRKDWSTVL